jgi:hypothetical protein
LPEIWIPYGPVESLVTVQAENLGQLIDPEAPVGTVDMGRITESVKQAASLFVCDSTPSTLELLKGISQELVASTGLKVYSAAPKRVEAGVPDLKGRVTTLPPPIQSPEENEPSLAPELSGVGRKIFVGTARPDPLFGLIDAKVEACLAWIAGSLRTSTEARDDMEPVPFQKSASYDSIEEISSRISGASFFTLIPRGGKLVSVMEDPPFDAIKNGFVEASVAPARAMVAGVGGKGFDDTLSSAIRSIWGVLPGVRRSGSVLLVAECSDGLGSTALEMLATGRLAPEGGRRKEKYVSGLEEIFYLNKLKQEFDILLLSGLPETYARGKLGLTTAGGSGEAIGRLLNKVGRTGKVNVVTRAAESRIISA